MFFILTELFFAGPTSWSLWSNLMESMVQPHGVYGPTSWSLWSNLARELGRVTVKVTCKFQAVSKQEAFQWWHFFSGPSRAWYTFIFINRTVHTGGVTAQFYWHYKHTATLHTFTFFHKYNDCVSLLLYLLYTVNFHTFSYKIHTFYSSLTEQ